MGSFLVRRLVAGVVLLVVIAVASFFLMHLSLGDPTRAILGDTATPEQQELLRGQLGLDRPLWEQFWTWASHAAVGDFGDSWRNKQSVNAELAQKLPVTLSIVTFAMVIAAVVGTIFGLAAGLRPGSALDRALKFVAVILFALPGFWVSVVLVIWFAINLRWFPAVGYITPTQSVEGWLRSITLPSVALSLSGIVAVAEQLRNAVVRVSGQDFVRTLRSRGLSGARVNTHVLRNASPAALTVLALQFVALVGGAIVVELVFNLPGIGAVTMLAANSADIPMLLGVTVTVVLFVVVINLLLDVVLGLINPKARTR